MSVRSLAVWVAIAALGLVGWRLDREGIGTHWLMLKLRFGGVATRRAAATEVRDGAGGVYLSDFLNCTSPNPGSPEWDRRRRQADVLIPAMLLAARDPDPACRARSLKAAEVLATLYAPDPVREDVRTAIVAASHDRDDSVRASAVGSLTFLAGRDPKAAIEALREALDDPSVEVGRSAAEALGMLGVLDPETQRDAAPVLMAVLASGADARVRARAAWGLGLFGRDAHRHPGTGPDVVPSLVAALRDGEVAVRRESAEILGFETIDARSLPVSHWDRRRDAILPALRAAMADGDAQVRQDAALALSNFGLREPPLLRLIEEGARDPDRVRRRRFEEAAASWGGEPDEEVP